MKFKSNNTEYNTTTDNKTYKLCHMAAELMCCVACANRRRREWYYLPKEKDQGKFPSWKLVSKNKKQYNKKPTWVEYHDNGWTTIKW